MKLGQTEVKSGNPIEILGDLWKNPWLTRPTSSALIRTNSFRLCEPAISRPLVAIESHGLSIQLLTTQEKPDLKSWMKTHFTRRIPSRSSWNDERRELFPPFSLSLFSISFPPYLVLTLLIHTPNHKNHQTHLKKADNEMQTANTSVIL